MSVTLRLQYETVTGDLVKGEYGDGQMAVTLEVDGQPWGRVSVNIVDWGYTAPEGHFYVRNYAEGEGMAAALEEAGVATSTGLIAHGPFTVTATLMKALF